MINALQMLRDFEAQDREAGERTQQRGLQNQMLKFQFAQQQQQAARELQRQNMLAQAVQSGDPNALMLADPKLGFQMQQMRSKEQMARERMTAQERMNQERLRMQQQQQNQPIWDADRGVFVQRPQVGMGGMGGGVIAPPGLPPRRNPEAEKLQAKAAATLPDALNQAEMAIQQIDQMIGSEKGDVKEHPGFQNAVGMPNVITGLIPRIAPGLVPGSDTASFLRRLKQIQGGAFLQAFESLKGGGQITEVEGKKATEAITRLDQSQSEAEFKAAARELQGILRRGMESAKRQAGVGKAPAAAPGQFRVLGVEGR